LCGGRAIARFTVSNVKRKEGEGMFAMLDVIGAGMGILGGTIALALALFVAVFWIWMLVDAVQNRGLSEGEKIGWVLAIVFFHILGSLLYFFIGRPRRT
jgi:Phospholipase_D-nuclease N-terminal